MTSSLRSAAVGAALCAITLFPTLASAQSLSNGSFKVKIGEYGEINSLQLTGDAFPTNYVLNSSNAPAGFAASADHAWVGELMFKYRLGNGAWTAALSSQSADARTITNSGDTILVTYQNSKNAQGISNFKVVESYALVDKYLKWQIAVTNTSSQTLELGDFGLPLPFNEYWFGNDVIYEQRTVYHSFIGNDSSYVTIRRPSGVGPFLLLVPDASTGAGFEYKDNWAIEEHQGSIWAQGGNNPWPTGLEVFYLHSNVIKSTNQGYLPNTSLTLAPNETKTYGFKFFSVSDDNAVKNTLYEQGLIDVTVVPSLMFATNMTGKFDLHTSLSIDAVTPQFPAESAISALPANSADHHLYQVRFNHLGPNDVTVKYGGNKTTVLQFYVLEPIDAALDRHAKFMVDSTQWSSGDMNHILDDWMMDTQSKRGATGGWGWGDDWGWVHGEFLAEKNAQTPVPREISALDDYLDAVWARSIDHATYVVQDWWCPAGTSKSDPRDCYYDRAYAYPHAFNTFFSMYKIASRYPKIVGFHQSADGYLLRAYGILSALYGGHGDPGTGYMGEQTLPEIASALSATGHTAEAQKVAQVLAQLHSAFKGSPYPYGSEYSYDNTGEEAVYTAARASGDTAILRAVNLKTRACRGQEPVWYWYADPVTLNGEGWWQFQYTASLAGYCMDDWVRTQSTTPELDERLSYAAKLANVSAINSGQMDSSPANLGTVSWTYQAMKGNVYRGNAETGKLHNGWRQMAGEADLGLFGAIRILSADVSVDPIFGVYGYGCEVREQNGCYRITPQDGVFKRLNLITEKLSLELDRDRYSGATLSKQRDYVGFTLQNQQPSAPHTTVVTVSGLPAGTYPVSVDDAQVGTLTAKAGQATQVQLAVGGNDSYSVRIGMGCEQSTSGPSGGSGAGTGGAGNGSAGAPGMADPAGVAGSSGGSSARGGSGTTVDAGTSGVMTAGHSGIGNHAPSPAQNSGCSCSTVRSRSSRRAAWLSVLLSLSVLRRRGRRLREQRAPRC